MSVEILSHAGAPAPHLPRAGVEKCRLSIDNILHTHRASTTAPVKYQRPRKYIPLRAIDRTDAKSKAVLEPNSPTPFELDNAIVKGCAVLKVRVPDQDDYYAPYFEGKKRTFEIQIQGQLKNISPDEQVFIGIETANPIHVGFFTKAIVNVILGLVSRTVEDAHCTLGDKKEPAQLVFPLDVAVDRLAVTAPGQIPPTLGVQMFPEEYSKTNRPALDSYNTTDTYSFSLHSMYVDLVNWKIVHLPGVGAISLDTLIGTQPLYFVGYVLPKQHQGPHLPAEKKYLFRFELDSDNRKKN